MLTILNLNNVVYLKSRVWEALGDQLLLLGYRVLCAFKYLSKHESPKCMVIHVRGRKDMCETQFYNRCIKV